MDRDREPFRAEQAAGRRHHERGRASVDRTIERELDRDRLPDVVRSPARPGAEAQDPEDQDPEDQDPEDQDPEDHDPAEAYQRSHKAADGNGLACTHGDYIGAGLSCRALYVGLM